ncbi:MAG: hydrogenase expression/formation protein HypE [Desulfurococcales archaeon]|nr:hydrogenase expression/formation protein HypE [Desulfurococcales archaeon]
MKEFVKLSHGSGGVEMMELLEKLIVPIFSRSKPPEGFVGLEYMDDGVAIPLPGGGYLVVSTDSYTVKPYFFPGGNIGVLAAAGSINDVLMMGGKPVAALDSIVVEEGFPLDDLKVIVDSMSEVFSSEGVIVMGGDFKVMPKGSLDGIIINTVVVGFAERLIVDAPKPGDKIVVSGPVGDHGAVILLYQLGAEAEEERRRSRLKSDVRPLSKLMLPLVERYGRYIHAASDPTRGGLAMVLNEWARKSGSVIVVEEDNVPIRSEVERYAGILGIDPLYLASEGVAVLSVDPSVAESVVEYVRSLGFTEASIVGEVRKAEKYRGYVLLRSSVGGLRILEPPRGELVPRIC